MGLSSWRRAGREGKESGFGRHFDGRAQRLRAKKTPRGDNKEIKGVSGCVRKGAGFVEVAVWLWAPPPWVEFETAMTIVTLTVTKVEVVRKR